MKEIQEGMTAAQVSATIMGNFSEVGEQVAEAKRLTAAEEERAKGAEQDLLSAVAQNVGDIKGLREVAATKEALSALAEQVDSNQQGVAKNAEDIEAEKQRSIAAEGEIRESVESLGDDLNAASEDISKLEVALEAEKSRAKAAEQALSTEITEAENRVDERVTEVRDDLEAEVQARSEAVAALRERIEGIEGGGTGVKTSYIHEAKSESNQWTIIHNMGRFPSVTLVDSTNTVIYGVVRYENENKIIVNFSAAISGKAFLN